MALRWVVLAFAAALAGCSGCSPGSSAGAGGRDAGRDAIPDVTTDAAPDASAADASDAPDDVYGSDWDAGMLSDPAIWTPVPDNGGCGLYVAKVVPDPFPKRLWTTCGTGCLVSDAAMPLPNDPQPATYWASTTASERAGDLYLRLAFETSAVSLTTVSRLGDGATIAAVEARNVACGPPGPANDMAFVVPFAPPIDANHRIRGATVTSTQPGAPVAWSHWLSWDGSDGLFAWDDGWGFSFGGLRVVTSPDQTAFQQIAAGSSFEVCGRGKQVVWYGSDGAPQNAVKGYTVAGGVKTLVKVSQGTVWSVAASDDKMAWIVVDGMDWANYRFDAANLYWSPLATDAKSVQIHGPAALPIGKSAGALTALRVGGDYAASHGCWPTDASLGECRIFVAQLSTGKVWGIKPRPGSGYLNVMAVSQDEILVGETNMPAQNPYDDESVRRFVRFKTADLDALQNGW